MDENNSIQLFEDRKIRTAWDEEKEEWYFSVVDVIAVLTDQPTARNASTYWAVLKKRLKEEGASELLTNCKQLKMRATDGKMRLTDVASTEQLLRIIQSIPSKKAEPFKAWLAMVGRERIEETIDPEQAIDRALSPKLAAFYDEISLDPRLFAKIKTVYDTCAAQKLNAQQLRLLRAQLLLALGQGFAVFAGAFLTVLQIAEAVIGQALLAAQCFAKVFHRLLAGAAAA